VAPDPEAAVVSRIISRHRVPAAAASSILVAGVMGESEKLPRNRKKACAAQQEKSMHAYAGRPAGVVLRSGQPDMKRSAKASLRVRA
jgi:hypothetical protein